jgi:DNA-binding HxlR family transcriptional regulator
MPRPKPTEPTRQEYRDRLLVVLRDAGGVLGRAQLRERIDWRLRAATLDQVAAELVRDGLVEVETVQRTHQALRGYSVVCRAREYRLTALGREAAARVRATSRKWVPAQSISAPTRGGTARTERGRAGDDVRA